MFLDDLHGQREPKSGSLASGLGREELLEDLLTDVWFDTGTVVTHGNSNPGLTPKVVCLAEYLNLTDKSGAVRVGYHAVLSLKQGIGRVGNEVGDHLTHSASETTGGWEFTGIVMYLKAFRTATDEDHAFFDDFIQVDAAYCPCLHTTLGSEGSAQLFECRSAGIGALDGQVCFLDQVSKGVGHLAGLRVVAEEYVMPTLDFFEELKEMLPAHRNQHDGVGDFMADT